MRFLDKLFGKREKSKAKDAVSPEEEGTERVGEADAGTSLVEEFDGFSQPQHLAKFLNKHSEGEISTFIERFPFSDMRLDYPSISRDDRNSKRFELVTYLAGILLRYETYRDDPRWTNQLPANLSASELSEKLLSKLIPFVETQRGVNMAMVIRTRLYELATDLIREDRNREAMVCLEVSRPSPKEDHDFWLCACYHNVGRSERDLSAVKAGIKLVEEITRDQSRVSDDVLQKLRQTDMLAKLKKLELELEIAPKNAVEAPDKMGARHAVERLIKTLQETTNRNAAWEVIEALIKMGDSAVEPLLKTLQEAPDGDVKWGVVKVLGELGDERAVEPLLEMFQEVTDRDLQGSVAEALGRLGDRRAVEPLLKSLSEVPNRDVVSALGRLGDRRAVEPLLELLQEVTYRDGQRSVIQKIEDRDWQRSVAEALGRLGDRRAVEPLLKLLQEDACESMVLGAAADALGDIGDPRATDMLITALKHKDGYVRLCAARSLGDIGESKAVQPLAAVLRDEFEVWEGDYTLRFDSRSETVKEAARSLSRIGGPLAQETLNAALHHGHPVVRKVAAEALAESDEA